MYIPYSMVPSGKRNLIKKTTTQLEGPDGSPLNIVGGLKVTLNLGEKNHEVEALIMKDVQIPLLGWDATVALGVFKNATREKTTYTVRGSCTGVKVKEEYPGLFNDIGEFREAVSISLKAGAKPYAQIVPRVVPLPMLPKLKKEIERLLSQQIIEPVEEVTEWVAPIVVVDKGNDEVRLCGDYTKLNKFVMRPYFPIPSAETTLGQLKNAKVFSKIDITKSFYQVKLDEKSQLLTTFITPFGRYKFLRLPFGISSSTEHFVMKFSKILSNVQNVVYHVDDVLIWGSTVEEHDKVLREVLSRMEKEGITINQQKSVFGVKKIEYLGHVLSEQLAFLLTLIVLKRLMIFPHLKVKMTYRSF